MLYPNRTTKTDIQISGVVTVQDRIIQQGDIADQDDRDISISKKGKVIRSTNGVFGVNFGEYINNYYNLRRGIMGDVDTEILPDIRQYPSGTMHRKGPTVKNHITIH